MLISAEIGSLHKQDQALAYEMIRRTAEAGADIAKFQLGWPKEDAVRHIDPWALFLSESCAFFGIEFTASLWSLQGLNLARMLNMRRYKVSHQVASATDPEVKRLFAAILSDGKETFISSVPPIRGAIKNARWLYCVPKYPAYPRDLQIPGGMGAEAEYYGYSSHTHGIGDALIAVARGAEYIEKHVTLDRELTTRDAGYAITFEELSELVRLSKEIVRLR